MTKPQHRLIMTAGTVAVGVAIAAALSAPFRTLLASLVPIALFLLCPLMMLFMHRSHGSDHNSGPGHCQEHSENSDRSSTQPPLQE